MGRIVIVDDPFGEATRRREYVYEGLLIDWLQEHYPTGFGDAAVAAAKNLSHLPVEDWDTLVGPEDVIAFVVQPKQVPWAQIFQAVFQALIQAAIAYAVNVLFNKPKTPGRNRAASPTYSFNSPQNEARLGEPIPVVYGEVILVPFYAAQPYLYYRDNNQYLVLLFALSRGNCTVEDVYVADSNVADMPDGVVRWQMYRPDEHLRTIGTIGADFGIYENVNTPIEVQDLDLQRSSDTIYRSMNFNAPDTLRHSESFPENFDVGATLTVSGSMSNDGTYTITDRRDGGKELELSPASIVAETSFTVTFTASFIANGDYEALFTLNSNTLPANIKVGMKVEFIPGGLFLAVSNAYIESLTTSGPSGFAEIGIRMESPYLGDTEIATRSWDMDLSTGPFSVSVGVIDDGYRGWYAVCKPGVIVEKIEIDLIWPNGIFRANDEGTFNTKSVTWEVHIQPIDDNGTPTGPVVIHPERFSGRTQTPQRRTFEYVVDEARYRVRLKRVTVNDPNSRNQSQMFWGALKGYIPYNTSFSVYGDTSILAVEARATSGLSGAAQSRFRVRTRRLLPTITSGFASEAYTTNPADVFADILMDQSYGAGRLESDLDITGLEETETAWTGTNGFNAVFDQRITVYDACATALAVNRGRLTAFDRQFGILREVPQDFSAHLFSPTQMLAQSFNANYALAQEYETDGVRIAYRDPLDFAERYALYPADSLTPEAVTLFGCTDYTHAYGYAKYLWLQSQGQRTGVTFDTELDGFLPDLGDRVTVAHPAVTWGNATRALEVTFLGEGYGLTLESPVTDFSTPEVWVYLRDRYGVAVGPLAGRITNEGYGIIVPEVPADLPDLTTAQDEPMTVAYGLGEDFARHYLLTEIAPQDSRRVSLTGVNYDPAIYVDTIPLPEWM